MKKQKQAFTLVELIVVITILAILGTIAFVSLQGYSTSARDSKRLSDINNIQKKIGIEIVKGTSLSSLISLVKTNSGLTIDGNNTASSIQGTANFQALKEDGSKFKDPITGGDYVLSYSVGGTGTGAYKFIQLSTINEEKNEAVVNGNYYQMQSGDSIGIIKNNSDSFVINEGLNLPYEPVTGGGDSGGPVYSCDDTSKPTDNGHITYVIGTPTSTNQAYIKDVSSCGYSCNDLYTGTNCEIAPLVGWRALDSNCDIEDITIGTQTWAGCNSTLGNGFEWGQTDADIGTSNYNGTVASCYDYNGNNTGVCTKGSTAMSSNSKANSWYSGTNVNGDTEYNTIWGKLYTFTNTASACPTGYHVPSDVEWTTLENYLNGSTCRTGDGRQCDGLGWKTNVIYNPDRKLADTLKIPLVGYRLTDGSTFYNRGNYTYLWSSTPNSTNAYYRFLYWNNSTVNRINNSQAYGFSVRCIKD